MISQCCYKQLESTNKTEKFYTLISTSIELIQICTAFGKSLEFNLMNLQNPATVDAHIQYPTETEDQNRHYLLPPIHCLWVNIMCVSDRLTLTQSSTTGQYVPWCIAKGKLAHHTLWETHSHSVRPASSLCSVSTVSLSQCRWVSTLN